MLRLASLSWVRAYWFHRSPESDSLVWYIEHACSHGCCIAQRAPPPSRPSNWGGDDDSKLLELKELVLLFDWSWFGFHSRNECSSNTLESFGTASCRPSYSIVQGPPAMAYYSWIERYFFFGIAFFFSLFAHVLLSFVRETIGSMNLPLSFFVDIRVHEFLFIAWERKAIPFHQGRNPNDFCRLVERSVQERHRRVSLSGRTSWSRGLSFSGIVVPNTSFGLWMRYLDRWFASQERNKSLGGASWAV